MMLDEAMQRLAAVLDAEERCYVELRNVLQRERECMVDLDAAGLEEAVVRKEGLADEAQLLADTRVEVVRRLAEGLGVEADPLTLTRICERIETDAHGLRERHARLTALLGAVQELVEANASFARQGLEQVRSAMNTLGRMLPPAPIYGASGNEGPSVGPGRLVRRVA